MPRKSRIHANALKVSSSDEIIACYQSGINCAAVARKYNVSRNFVKALIVASGSKIRPLSSYPHKFTLAQRDSIAAEYVAGASLPKLAEKYHLHFSTIWHYLKQRGITSRTISETRNRKPLDPHVFDTITPESAYWIGFIMADGCVTDDGSFAICCTETDGAHLRKLHSFLKSGHSIHKTKADKRWNSQSKLSFTIRSRTLVDSLAKYGIVPRKSHTAKVIGLETNPDFWRGVVDGDGYLCIVKSKTFKGPVLGIVGSKDMCQQFSNFARLHVPKAKATVLPMHSIFSVRVNGIYATIMTKLLYENAPIALNRKAIVAQKIMQTFHINTSDTGQFRLTRS